MNKKTKYRIRKHYWRSDETKGIGHVFYLEHSEERTVGWLRNKRKVTVWVTVTMRNGYGDHTWNSPLQFSTVEKARDCHAALVKSVPPDEFFTP